MNPNNDDNYGEALDFSPVNSLFSLFFKLKSTYPNLSVS